ncbi:hypothetical protein [Streptomyces nanshensis]|uniref:DUF4064 domain-containing protein n=1 Tax=Streptomyces nanshensis TaxID=518642 RepID=A0A1E7LBQ1_9ACTN|nr:hypothetical protein [Streptomyces nanshensis]OEV13594.1 hypothetical protein AN218_02810 [Streptomyces nanshensis]
MSYPPPPGQDPNNPYAQPPPQQAYGYPQQPQGGQPGYGYPQQGGFQQPVQGGYPQQPGFTYPNAPQTMPGTVNAVRIILFIMGGLGIIGAIYNFVQAATFSDTVGDAEFASIGTGVIIAGAVLGLIFSAAAIFLASQFTKGGNAIRICCIVYGSLMALGGLFGLIVIVGIIPLALGVLIIVFMAKQDGAQWFNRARY